MLRVCQARLVRMDRAHVLSPLNADKATAIAAGGARRLVSVPGSSGSRCGLLFLRVLQRSGHVLTGLAETLTYGATRRQ